MTGYTAKVGLRKPQRGVRVRLRKGEYVVTASDIAAYRQMTEPTYVLKWGSDT